MGIGVYSFSSPIHSKQFIDNSLVDFIGSLEKELGSSFVDISLEDLKDYDCPLIFIKSGGVEGDFKEHYKSFKEPFLLLTSGMHNSLAASLEILSFLKQQGLMGEIIHGDTLSMANRIKTLQRAIKAKNDLQGKRLGCIGTPSDWLISSNVDYSKVKEKLGVEILDIPIQELIDNYNKINCDEYEENKNYENLFSKGFDKAEVTKSLRVYDALKLIVSKYCLSGLTLRCFDLLGTIKTTGCTALSVLNSEGIISSCEGDVPALLSMLILNSLSGEPVFMANPSRIDTINNEMVLAHCTLPLNMPEEFTLDTHFESRIGVGIKGNIKEGPATVFKLSSSLDEYFVSAADILENLNDVNLCRTQIKIHLDEDVNYFLKNSLGNHHLICKGNYVNEVVEFTNLI